MHPAVPALLKWGWALGAAGWAAVQSPAMSGLARTGDAGPILIPDSENPRSCCGLRWRFVILATALTTLPADNHKTGAKTGAARVIGLPAPAVDLLRRRPQRGPDDLVFSPAPGAAKVNLALACRKMRVAADLPEGITRHGQRHPFAAYLAVQVAQAAEIMAASGHKYRVAAQRDLQWARDQGQDLAKRAVVNFGTLSRRQVPLRVNIHHRETPAPRHRRIASTGGKAEGEARGTPASTAAPNGVSGARSTSVVRQATGAGAERGN